jgi:hypothetical protein
MVDIYTVQIILWSFVKYVKTDYRLIKCKDSLIIFILIGELPTMTIPYFLFGLDQSCPCGVPQVTAIV